MRRYAVLNQASRNAIQSKKNLISRFSEQLKQSNDDQEKLRLVGAIKSLKMDILNIEKPISRH